MSYNITVNGAFRITPAANDQQREIVEQANRGWKISPNGTLLHLPAGEDHPNPFLAIEYFVTELLPSIGLRAEGEVRWHGEDGGQGEIGVANGTVVITTPEPKRLDRREVERLLDQLTTGSDEDRKMAAQVLQAFNEDGPEVIAALAVALSSASVEVRIAAANLLAAFGPKALPALSALRTALRDSEAWVQAAAAEAIGEIGPAAAIALPDLVELRKHPSYGPSGRALEAIRKLGLLPV